MRVLTLAALATLAGAAILPAVQAEAASAMPALTAPVAAAEPAIQPVGWYYWHGGRYPYRWHGGYYHHRRRWHGYWRYY